MTTLIRRDEQAAKVSQLRDTPAMEAASRIFHRCNLILSDNGEKLAPQSNDDDDGQEMITMTMTISNTMTMTMVTMTMVRSLSSKLFSSTEGFCAQRATGKLLFGRRG